MIAVGEDQPVGNRVRGAVPEREGGFSHSKRRQRHAVGETAQRQDCLEPRHGHDFRCQEGQAGPALGGRRAVFRRHAAHGVGDPAIGQREPVVRPPVIAAGGETVAGEGVIEQVAGPVAGEGPAGPVRAAQSRRQADDQQPGIERTEGRDGRIVPGRLPVSPFRAKGGEPRT